MLSPCDVSVSVEPKIHGGAGQGSLLPWLVDKLPNVVDGNFRYMVQLSLMTAYKRQIADGYIGSLKLLTIGKEL